MARDIDLKVNVKAKDDASKVLDKVADKAEDLEKTKIEIPLDADVSQVLSAFEQVAAETKEVAAAADALGRALGPELAAKADPIAIVNDLKTMGLTLDQITANADQLGAKMRELSDVDVGGKLGANLGTTRGKIDQLAQSAGSSKSVLANMVGNATQDVGALAGVAGSAGVAIGQMGEYMADAASSGDKFGDILRNFGKVAGPIAGIALATQAVSTYMAGIKAEKALRADLVDRFADSMEDAADATEAVGDAIEDIVTETNKLEFSERGGGFLGLGRSAGDLLPTLDRLGISLDEFNTQVEDAAPHIKAARDELHAMATGQVPWDNQRITDLQDYIEGLDQFADSAATANEEQTRRNAALAAGRQASIDARVAENRHQQALDDMADAYVDGTGMVRKHSDAVEDDADAQRDASRRAQEYVDALIEQKRALQDATAELDAMDDTFETMSRREGVIEAVFAVGNAPLEAAAGLRDVNQAIGELSEAAADLDLSEGIDVSDISFDPLLDAFDSIRPQIQESIANAFEAGGPEAARKVGQSFIDNIFTELGGKISKEDIARLLGVEGGIDAFVNVIVQQEALAKARATLELLTGVQGGPTPYTASIALALDAGTITPAQAQALVLAQLAGEGVTLPSGLGMPSQESIDAATAALAASPPALLPVDGNVAPLIGTIDGQYDAIETALAAKVPLDGDPAALETTVSDSRSDIEEHGAIMPVGGNTGALVGAVGEAKSGIRRGETMPVRGNYTGTDNVPKQITIPVKGKLMPIAVQAGGPVDPSNLYMVGEAGRELFIPNVPGRIIPHGATEQMMHSSSGAAVVASTPINITIRTAVIGNAFDVMRTVRKAASQGVRLAGSRK